MQTDRPTGAISESEAAAWRARQRVAGRRVAFTNGCFDLLHAGHIDLLCAARARADSLIVAINDDAGVRALKGPGRPVVPESERAELLAALEPVDRVVLFTEATPLRIIEALLPDVLVKGADWAEDRIVGAREVRAAGGEVIRVPLAEGLSTTALLQRIRQRFRGDDPS